MPRTTRAAKRGRTPLIGSRKRAIGSAILPQDCFSGGC